jgi:SAM-dependent methyltransferase
MLSAQDKARFALLKSIFRRKEVDVLNAFGAGFYEYFNPIFNDQQRFDEYTKFCKRVFDLTRARKKRALDLGCGFGLMSIHFALFGASDVFAVDVDKQRLFTFEKILSIIKPPLENVHLVLGEEEKTDFEDDFFDVVVMIDTISYIKRPRTLSLEVKRVLKPGGTLFISEMNNVLSLLKNTAYRRHLKAAQAYDIKLLEIKIEKILQEHPCVNLEELKKLWSAEKLKLSEKDVFWIAEAFTRRQEFDPFQLKIMLDDLGFESSIIRPLKSHTASGLRGRMASKFFTLVALSHPVSLVVAPYFNILAINKS